jgi:hypothetical protein
MATRLPVSIHQITTAGLDQANVPLTWSSDGSMIVFHSERDGNSEIRRE